MKICSNYYITMPKTRTFKGNGVSSLYKDGDIFTSYYDKQAKISERWYQQNKDIVKKIYEDKNGDLLLADETGTIKPYKFSDVFQKYEEPLGVLVHGTSEANYKEIMENGFKIKKDNFAETIRGIYFTVGNEANTYGEKKIYATFDGNVFKADTNKILALKYNKTMLNYLSNLGISSEVSAEEVALNYLKDKMRENEVDGFISADKTLFTKCICFVTDQLDKIKIIK